MIYMKRDVDMRVHPYLLAGLAYLGYRSKYDWKVTSGRRTPEQQAAIYAEGRTTPGTARTDTLDSPHVEGLAVDAYPTVDGGQTIILDLSHPAFAERDKLFRENSTLNRLLRTDVVISTGPDTPHIEVRDWKQHRNWQNTAIAVTAVTALVSIFLLTR